MATQPRERRRAVAFAAAFPVLPVLALVAGASGIGAQDGAGPGARRSPPARAARFLVVGDTGTGDDRARLVAARIRNTAATVSASHLFFLGDNVYEEGEDIERNFLDVYRSVFALGVRTHASFGNHDVENCRDSGRRPVRPDASAYRAARNCWVDSHLATPEFGYLEGRRYYSVEIPGGPLPRQANGGSQPGPGSGSPGWPGPLVEVFVLDSNTLRNEQTKIRDETDEPQLGWFIAALERSRARWKVVAMHHAMYTPTKCRWLGLVCRGDDRKLRAELEPIFTKHGVDVVFQAHQHLYARLKPQRGIRYFVSGAGAKLPDSFREDPRTVPREDRGAFNHFLYVRATAERFGYCVVDVEGAIRDSGSFGRGDAPDGPFDGDLCRPPAPPGPAHPGPR